ncbi:MAG: TIGR04551 family protein [Polyangiales bacterium]
MRRPHFSSYFALASLLVSLRANAQEPVPADAGAAQEPSAPPAAEPAPESTPAEPAAEPAEPAPPPAPENPRVLEPPNLSPLELERDTLPDPAAAANRLENAAPPPLEKKRWTLPETVFHLHGYMRVRTNYLKDGALGHSPQSDRLYYEGNNETGITRGNYDPFPYFTPDDSTRWSASSEPVEGGCGDNRGANGGCGKKGQVSGDMRLRLKPEIHLSDDVRVKAWIDVMDNVGLGTLGYGPGAQPADLSSGNAIRARRMWGEARNRDIGELRFGRMGADWGLGILDNGGDRYGIDSDFSSDVDRVMGMTNLAGFYIMAAYDWASEGRVLGRQNSQRYLPNDTPSGIPIDAAQRDDLDAFTGAVAHKLDEDVQQATLARGEAVFNYGLYFIYRNQVLNRRAGIESSVDYGSYNSARYTRLNQQQFIPDLWMQFLWEGLRVELEAAFVAGKREGQCPWINTSGEDIRNADENLGGAGGGSCKFRQLGLALESEYRLFDERLGIYFNTGFASGDSNAYGLAQTNDPSYQRSADASPNNTISTYQFHPDYRVDLILWRTVMRRVAGAYYFKPGISYDFIRDPYGQQAGARLDAIYSRASNPKQSWGNSGNLGLELDLSLYYRSEDGPDITDGFYGMVQFGVLFPFDGMNFQNDPLSNSKNALILRGVAGIAF